MQRRPQQTHANRATLDHHARQLLWREALQARPERDIRIERVLGLQPDEVLDQHLGGQRDTGQQVMQTLLQAHPDVTAVYAHTDEMALGAIAALQEAGRKPGQDVILVSIDGENAALDAILDGTLGASVETDPFFGPIAFETMQKYIDGEDLPDWVKVKDRFFDQSNAAEFQGKQY